MTQIEIILGLLLVIAALAWLANRLRVPYPIFLTIGGLGISFIPHAPRLTLEPDLVFLLFLPPILYYAGMNTSWRDFRANIRPISMLAIGLVLFTTVAVALAAHAIAGMNWATSFLLGAIVSPPDAVAATTILRRVHVPRVVETILEGESLVNDATALVTYKFAIAAVVAGSFSLWDAGLHFVMVSVGGVGIGLLAGVFVVWLRPRLRDPAVENVVSLLSPYFAYLPAEWLHVSGVLSVVTAGIYISRRIGRISTAQVRLRAYAIWDVFIFLLNGLIFILIGLQVSRILQSVPMGEEPRWIVWPMVISAVAIVARLFWVLSATYATRRIGTAKFRARNPVPPFNQVFLVAWTQMRGVVSLAAALALPLATEHGATFPDRDKIIFITFGVILVTLVAQGLTLPAVIRALRVKTGAGESENEEVTARYLAALAAIERLDALGAKDASAAAALQRLRATYDDQVGYYIRFMNPDGNSSTLTCETGEMVEREAIHAQRDMLVRLRDQGVIGDDVLRSLEHELDLEESNL